MLETLTFIATNYAHSYQLTHSDPFVSNKIILFCLDSVLAETINHLLLDALAQAHKHTHTHNSTHLRASQLIDYADTY